MIENNNNKPQKKWLSSDFSPLNGRKKWRHHEPKVNITLPNHPISNRLKGVVNSFDWHKCKPMIELRKNGGKILTKVLSNNVRRYRIISPRRLSIRKERLIVLNGLLKLIIKYANFDHDAQFLFECNRSLEELARDLGMLHSYAPLYDTENIDTSKYTHGRKSCDPVRAAIDDLEAAGLIIVVREYDKDVSQYKMSRLFLRPAFFESLGLSMRELKTKMELHKKFMKKKAKTTRFRPINNKFASIKSNKLLSLLDYDRRKFNALLSPDYIQATKDVIAASNNGTLIKKGQTQNSIETFDSILNAYEESPHSEIEKLLMEVRTLLNQTPHAIGLSITQGAQALYPIDSIEYLRYIKNRLMS
jgi:hypothetical protein